MMMACGQKEISLFQHIDPKESGLTFANILSETDSIHYFNFPYIYTGAGVGIADFNNDGLQDIFLAGNMVSSRLYINEGALVFTDVSDSANIHTHTWATGVSCVDINQDGWQDIYLCVGGYAEASDRKNRLFINNQDLTFTESAASYGIDDDHHSTQAAFLDYDNDGDLDLYVMEHANEPYQMLSKLHTYQDGTGPSTDRLFENIGKQGEQPTYRDVSAEAGILIEGYGLGLSILDINQDGWSDIYVANDYLGSDILYENNRDGTFTNRLDQYFDHCSRNAMGIDVGDLNNDALPDLFILDMLPQSNERQKTMTSKMNYNHFIQTIERGFAPQFIRNTLQLNRGKNPAGQYYFSETARFAGLHQTDWSWGPLIADFDNDGLSDVYVTNGIRRDVTNHDFQEYTEQRDIFTKGQLSIPDFVEKLKTLDAVNLSNYIFQNCGNLQFSDQTRSWGVQYPSLSNGAAYGDLDNDGDIDLVVNNIDQPVFLFRNNARTINNHHFIQFSFSDSLSKEQIAGTQITLFAKDQHWSINSRPVHGYMSSSMAPIHVGLGITNHIDSLVVHWPDRKRTVLQNVPIDTLIQIRKREIAAIYTDQHEFSKDAPIFKKISGEYALNYLHRENTHNEFRYQPLLLRHSDNLGPGIAISPTHENTQLIYIGGARGQAGTIIKKHRDHYTIDTLPHTNRYEDMGALFLDVDNDGDDDLYVVSGGSSVKYFNKGHYQDRIYLNDGTDKFTIDTTRLPKILSSGSCVVAADMDADGDLDLFVGGRVVPGKYPSAPRSYLLINENGKFIDGTGEFAPDLSDIGMVSAALWTDYDHDFDKDLMVLGEWMPITIFNNEDGRLAVRQDSTLDHYRGWWNSIAGGDLDHDGDIDYIAGNLGENTAYKATHDQPLRMYVNDFDENGSIDGIVTRYIHDLEYPIAPRGALIDQLELINYKFPSYQSLAEADMKKILEGLDTVNMQVMEAGYLKSVYIENKGHGRFQIKPLPMEAQLSPIFGIEIYDFDRDGSEDVLCIGNDKQTEVISGWYDGQKGLFLKGNGQGNLTYVDAYDVGFYVEGEGRALASSVTGNIRQVFAAKNNDSLEVFTFGDRTPVQYFSFRNNEDFAVLKYQDGSESVIEKYFGHGFLTQSQTSFSLPATVDSVYIYRQDHITRTLSGPAAAL